MEEKKVMTPQVKGLLISLIMIIVGLIGYYTKMNEKSGFSWATNGLLFILFVWACIFYSNQKNGYVTFGNIFAHGFKTSAVVAIILLVWTLICVTLLFPDIKERAIEIAQQRMDEKGNLTDAQIQQGLDITRKYFTVILVVGVILGTLIVGVLASLLGAAVAKKNPNNPMEQLDRLDQPQA